MLFVLIMCSLLACAALCASSSGIAGWLKSQPALSWVSRIQRAVSMTKRALFLLIASLFIASNSFAATAFGTAITNTATASYNIGGTPVTSQGSVTITTAGRTAANIEFLQYVSSGTLGSVQNVNPTQCAGNNLPAPNFIAPPSTTLTVPGALRLAPATQYASGDPVFMRVTDQDQNASATAIDTIKVTITTLSGDSETLTLAETGLSTGVFIGYVQSSNNTLASNNCALNVASNQKVSANYSDPLDTITTVADAALFDPFGSVFDSSTGLGVNGASVTIIDTTTNSPATVFCDDGVTVLPQPVISGQNTVCDAAVIQGGYRFPRMVLGNYKLVITPPANYSFASTVANPALQALPGAPFQLIVGSRGEPFDLQAGPLLQIDVPIDPAGGTLQITKTASKTIVGEGEFVPYTITIKNNSLGNTINVKIADTLPVGFRYAKNSAKLEGKTIAEPSITTDGRTLNFSLGSIASGAKLTLKYVAEVTMGAKTGFAENIAFATSHPSNTGRATVTIREDLFKSKSILVGRVLVGECQDEPSKDGKGLAGARILLQDGTYIITDKEGRWHADNIRPGTHVVQLDLDSLPKGYSVQSCQDNSRFAGRSYSQFVNLRAGSLWRADFYVKKVETDADAKLETPETVAQAIEKNKKDASLAYVEQLPYNTEWLATTAAGTEWLHPASTFQPAIPAIKVAVKTVPGQKIAITINGQAISPLNYDGMIQNTAKTVALSTWSGVGINAGDNKIETVISDKDGKELLRETRVIHYSSGPDKAVFVAEKSQLVADGKTKPIVAIRFLDIDGKPVRRGISGNFSINAPYQSADLLDAVQRNPLGAKLENKATYNVGADGIALIALAPTTQTGEVVLNFEFNAQLNQARKQEIRNWLTPGQRDWVLVGFGQGTIGHKKLSGNMKALKTAEADDELFDNDQLAFYAKGTVKGEYLITAAYDTAKQKGTAGATANLKQAIDPNRYYTLYADATQPYFDAPSASKLYVKVERKQFYAMFGDFDTGLTVTELSRYSRTLNGVKSEFKNEKYAYNAFATLSKQGFIRDEIRGEGTSGQYKLSRGNIIENSDKISIETRDRFKSQDIVSTHALTRYLDYDIDYNLGTIFFREPVMSRDGSFNPVFIVAEFEANDQKDEKLSVGGRASYKPNAKTEVGATLVHEGNTGASGNLRGVDAQYEVDDKTKIRAEIANSNKKQTKSGVNNAESSGNAYLIEATHQEEKYDAKAYVRQQDEGFGLGQQAGSETGTRKIGAEGRYKVNETTQVQAQAYRQQTLETDATRVVGEARVEQKFGEANTYYGGRLAKDTDGAGLTRDSKQAVAGVNKEFFNKKLVLRASTELGFGKADSTDFPDRLTVGADYKLTEKTTTFAEHEFAWSDAFKANMTRIGLRTQPWTGGEANVSVGNQIALDGNRTFANFGLLHKWQMNEHWQSDFGLDRSQTFVNKANASNGATTNGSVNPINSNVPLASGNSTGSGSGNSSGDFTAVSAGVNYTNESFSSNARIEVRDGVNENKLNLVLGAARTLNAGETLAAGLILNETKSNAGSHNSKLDLRFSYALRPNDSNWIWLDRVDFISEKQQDTLTNSRGLKLVNNFNANYMPNRRTQLSLLYGAKYVADSIDGEDYQGYTDIAAAELRYDITNNWDIGLHASVLNSWNSNIHVFGAGASVGYRVMDNSWLSVGYNFMGQNDGDFTGAEYRAKGAYATLRVKFDQESLKLNKK
jgi:uncharacterized repeat protein (TIGR01451 family)